MRTTTTLELRPIAELKPYEHNARTHSADQIEKLRASMREFGFVAPILITSDGGVIAGHGRIEAAVLEGFTEAPCVLVDHLTETQRHAYILADNRLAELASWDEPLVTAELAALEAGGFDLELTGFEPAAIELEPVDGGNFRDRVETETSEEYEKFVERHTPKRTTDDCYTPANVYAAVKTWACAQYGLESCRIVRPFFPGGDYQSTDYSGDCVVIDNPPFSILSEICRWYSEHRIRFFLFAPGTTLFSIASGEVNYIPTCITVVYENGANISTSFVTNLGDCKLDTAPELYASVATANEENMRELHAELPVYVYPGELVSVQINKLAKYGQRLQLKADDLIFVRALDAQREQGKVIFGGGFLISEKAAAEKAAAEKAAAERAAAEKAAAEKAAVEKAAAKVWPLSDRERELISKLGGGGDG